MAWFNLGTSRYKLQDYQGAAEAYDQALVLIYPTIPEEQRPWRMLWYQTGPYFAYYYTGRYQDVINLADQAIAFATIMPSIEESWYWRAMAELKLGERSAAIDNLNTSLYYHPGFGPSTDLMQQEGVPTPTPSPLLPSD
jgi:tetratricopeptide (TPR) repeat protein